MTKNDKMTLNRFNRYFLPKNTKISIFCQKSQKSERFKSKKHNDWNDFSRNLNDWKQGLYRIVSYRIAKLFWIAIESQSFKMANIYYKKYILQKSHF